MHMADALISPPVGAVMWAASAATTAYCAKRLREEADTSRIPLMGVSGAFVFAAQMVNFTIPGTGSSGHLGGGLLLAVLLGPEAAFLVMASVLTIQALFFADGGLLALGANIFNLGALPAFLAYALVYRRITATSQARLRLIVGALLAAVVALEAGAFGVVVETAASGIAELPFVSFFVAMLPIHLAIGIVEGLVTAAVLAFVREAQPEILGDAQQRRAPAGQRVVIALLVATLVAGGVLSWFASSNPDGLEWSVQRVAGKSEPGGERSAIREVLESLQEKTALFPDYSLRKNAVSSVQESSSTDTAVGAVATLLAVIAVAVGLSLRAKRRRTGHSTPHARVLD